MNLLRSGVWWGRTWEKPDHPIAYRPSVNSSSTFVLAEIEVAINTKRISSSI
jgi:hypothetical protein